MSLASIQKILEVNPIPNADNIEVVKVLGWEVVVKKGEFNPDDLCIFIEIDSLIPKREWSEFLFKDSDADKEYVRLRTVKLRGQISQGLVLPIDILLGELDKKYKISWHTYGTLRDLTNDWHDFSVEFENDDGIFFTIGSELTEYLGIKKYEKPMPKVNPRTGIQAKGNFPSFLRKTDEIRIQSAPELLEKLKGQPYYITQKMDGTSATYFKYKGKFGVCSRNLELQDPRTPKGLWSYIRYRFWKLFGKTNPKLPPLNVYWKMAFKYDIENWLPDGFAIQGEICGPAINGNKMGLEEHRLYIFNYFDIDRQEYRNPFTSWQYVHKPVGIDLNCHLVPMLEMRSADREFDLTIEHLLDIAKAIPYDNGTPQEGIVVRSLDQKVSFKVINIDYLLKYGE